ncbi:MAG TPA: caspase family protein, partial [Campylobacterales bacterium]|nr:caspase family protein [Campylobacterales bacterium]
VTKVVSNEDATKQNITALLDEMAKNIQPQDLFVFFGASHGVLFDGQYYLVTHSYNGVLDPNTMISSNDIINASKQIAAFKQLFILDTCHAGGLDAVMSGLYDSKMSVLAKKSGLHIYASAGSQQTAIDGYKGNGLFTYVLLNALGEPVKVDKSKEGRVSVEEMGIFTKDMTSNISASIGHKQTPTILHFGKDYDLIKVK